MKYAKVLSFWGLRHFNPWLAFESNSGSSGSALRPAIYVLVWFVLSYRMSFGTRFQKCEAISDGRQFTKQLLGAYLLV